MQRYGPALASIGFLLACATAAFGQPQGGPTLPSPRLYTVSPPGGKLGATIVAAIGGADLEETFALYLSHPGLRAVPIPDPFRPGSFLAGRFLIHVAADVPVGIHDVRAIGKYGISNPRAFSVGDLTEIAEREPNNDAPQAQPVELNTTVNGVINPNTDVDYYSFAGKKGQRVMVACAAFSIDSRLQPLVQIFNPQGRQLAANRRYYERDAVVEAAIPTDGVYLVRITEHAHLSGSPEHFYRLTFSQAPWIDAAYPPVVEPAKPTKVTLLGRNLPDGVPDPGSKLDGRPLDRLELPIMSPRDPASGQRLAYGGTVPTWSAGMDGFEYRLRNAVGFSNPILLGYARGPIILDNEDNDSPDKPQEIPPPCELCGRVEKKGDRDWFVFTAKQNEVLVLDAFCDRLGVPVDLFFEIRRLDNKQVIGEFDDNTENLSPLKFNTQSDDPRTRFVVPADGKYLLLVGSRTSDMQASPRFVYWLSIRREEPDFRLVLMDGDDFNPSASTIPRGGGQLLNVFCFRGDGFGGEIAISVEGLPPGLSCPPQVLGANMKQAALVVRAAPDAPPWAGEIKVKGKAAINGQTVVREARGGCIVWGVQPGANIPALGRLSRSICLAVRDQGPFSLEQPVAEASVPVGGALPLKLKVNRHWPEAKAPLVLAAVDVPPNTAFGNNNQPLTIAADKGEAEATFAVRSNAAPGTYNLVLRGTMQIPFNKDRNAQQKPPVTAIEVAAPTRLTVYNTVAEVSLNPPSVSVKPGTETELAVRVNRLNGYKGPLKVQIVPPQGFSGVTAAEGLIPENAAEGKLVLKSPANAAPASNPNVVVRVVATIDKVVLNHDAKLTVNVVK